MEKIILKNSFEGNFINYYEKFFINSRKEQVQQEIKFVNECLVENSNGINNILDVGCGTGYHAEHFSEYFTEIVGLDISKDMINYASQNHKKNNLKFICQDIRSYETYELFDAAMALSHVIGYQLENCAVEEMLLSINKTLKSTGILFFNFYYAPAILTKGLAAKVKTVSDDNLEITRYSNATLLAEESAIALEYLYFIEENIKNNTDLHKINIYEKMRYFSKLEIDYFLQKTGFKALKYCSHLSKKNINTDNWNACVIAKKVMDK